jgi:hypothetical protein
VVLALTTVLGLTVTAAPAHAATYKWVANWIYVPNAQDYRAWIGAYIATSNDGRVNDVLKCEFRMQVLDEYRGVWLHQAWDFDGYAVYEYDHSTGAYYHIADSYELSPSSTVSLTANTHGNYLASHGVGCWFGIYLDIDSTGPLYYATGAVWDGPT